MTNRPSPFLSLLPPHRHAKTRRRYGTGREEGHLAPAADPGDLARQGEQAQGGEGGEEVGEAEEAGQVRFSFSFLSLLSPARY
jgi:hypothetical protein